MKGINNFKGAGFYVVRRGGLNMENTVLTQGYLFLVYIISGVIIGVIFDIFRVFRRTFKTTDFATYLQDILFWIITGIFLLFILFKFSNGEIRVFNIIGIIIGCIFYIVFISKYFIKVNVSIVKFIKNIISNVINVLLYPIKFIIKILFKIFTPFTFFVVNIKKVLLGLNKKEKNKKKNKKIILKRRILKSNVEK